MTTIFSKSEQGTLVFHVIKPLKYPYRIALSLLFIISGFIVQGFYYSAFPGILLVIAGNLLVLVKGYDNRLTMGKLTHYSKWESIGNEQVNKLVAMHKKILSWDRSAFDISNVLGFMMFLILSVVIFIMLINGARYYTKSYAILALNIIVLIVPHWFTGIRKILTLPVLIMKINLLNKLLNAHQDVLSKLNNEFLVQLAGESESKVLPQDIKIRVSAENAPEAFLGLYGQITVNDVNGTKFPYFYVVLVAKPEFNLVDKTKSYTPPLGLIKEYTAQTDVDVLIIRQFTTSTSGYNTSENTINSLFDEGLGVFKNIALT